MVAAITESDYVFVIDEETAIAEVCRRAKLDGLVFHIDGKLTKMGYRCLADSSCNNTDHTVFRVYREAGRNCITSDYTLLADSEVTRLYKGRCGVVREVSIDEFLKETEIPKLAIEDIVAVGGSLHAEMLTTIEAYTRRDSTIEMNLHWPLNGYTATLYTITYGVRKKFTFLKSHVLTRGSERITYLALAFGVLI